MIKETFRKRTRESRLFRESTWFNMGNENKSPSRLRLIYFAEEDCLKGKNTFSITPGLFWVFHFVPNAKRSLVVNGSVTKQLLPEDLYVKGPVTETSKTVREKEVLENQSSVPVKRYYFAIERNIYMEQMFRMEEWGLIHLADAETVLECVEEMAERVRNDKNCSAQELSILLFRFLTLLSGEQREYSHGTGNYERLMGTIRHFPQDYPTLKSLENAFRVSAGTLRKIFLRLTGKSPIDFVVHARLKNSCWMLTDSELSIREIAVLNGYSSVAFYSNAFKKAVGVSPSQYRKDGRHYFPDDCQRKPGQRKSVRRKCPV